MAVYFFLLDMKMHKQNLKKKKLMWYLLSTLLTYAVCIDVGFYIFIYLCIIVLQYIYIYIYRCLYILIYSMCYIKLGLLDKLVYISDGRKKTSFQVYYKKRTGILSDC